MGLVRKARVAHIATLLALASAAVVPISAQQSPQAPIRRATRLVQVNVITRNKNGSVPNLAKDDFVVLDRGKPRDITVFTAESAPASPQPAQPLPPNTFSNLSSHETNPPRSVTIVLLDNLNTLYGSAPQDQYESTPSWIEDLALQRARTQLLEFLEVLDPQDRVAIYGLRDSLHVLCDFTSDRAQLLAIVSKYDTSSRTNRAVVEPAYRTAPLREHTADPLQVSSENGSALRLAGIANEERAKITMAALSSIANHVANIPGRKNLVWLTAELPFSGTAMARLLSPANIAVYPVDARGLLPRRVAPDIMSTADADDVSGASGHYDNMPAQSSVPIGIPTMQKLAEETGGQAFVNTNDITGAIRKAVEDSAVTYTLGFYIDSASLDGKFHELRVQVKRKGLTVRYPRGYFAFEDAPATNDEKRNDLATAVRNPIESSAIPVKVRIVRVDQPLPHCLSIFGSIDIRNLHLAESGGVRSGALDVVTIEQDESGKVLAQSGSTIKLQFAQKQYLDYLKAGFPFHQYVQPQEHATTLRILVDDPDTAGVGSLIIPLSQLR